MGRNFKDREVQDDIKSKFWSFDVVEQKSSGRPVIEIDDEKNKTKKYYDMQVAERQKDEQFEKILDGEQARIWKKDCDKYNEDEKRIEKIIRDKNVRNLNTIKEQIRIKKEKEKNNMGMTPTVLFITLLLS